MRDTTISLRLAPRGQSFANAPAVQVRATNPPQPLYNAQLQVDGTGDWDLEARVEGANASYDPSSAAANARAGTARNAQRSPQRFSGSMANPADSNASTTARTFGPNTLERSPFSSPLW